MRFLYVCMCVLSSFPPVIGLLIRLPKSLMRVRLATQIKPAVNTIAVLITVISPHLFHSCSFSLKVVFNGHSWIWKLSSCMMSRSLYASVIVQGRIAFKCMYICVRVFLWLTMSQLELSAEYAMLSIHLFVYDFFFLEAINYSYVRYGRCLP